MKPPPSPLPEPHLFYAKRKSVVIGDLCSNGPQCDNVSTTSGLTRATVIELLSGIHDLLQTRAYNKEQQRHEADKETEIKNDWMLAAAVLDRICAIIFSIALITGTVAFAVLFNTHYKDHKQ